MTTNRKPSKTNRKLNVNQKLKNKKEKNGISLVLEGKVFIVDDDKKEEIDGKTVLECLMHVLSLALEDPRISEQLKLKGK